MRRLCRKKRPNPVRTPCKLVCRIIMHRPHGKHISYSQCLNIRVYMLRKLLRKIVHYMVIKRELSLIGKKPYRKRDHVFCHREHSMKLIRSVRLLICLKYKSVVFYYNQTVKRYLSFMKPSDKFCNSLFRQSDSLRPRFF